VPSTYKSSAAYATKKRANEPEITMLGVTTDRLTRVLFGVIIDT
jgi:hypothetical protein